MTFSVLYLTFGKRLSTTIFSDGGLDQVTTQCVHHKPLLLVTCGTALQIHFQD